MKTKLLAVLAVLAMAFAGVAVAAEQNDAAGETYEPTAFAYGYDSSGVDAGMRVISYHDKVLLINTNGMNLSTLIGGDSETGYSYNTFYVGLKVGNGAELKVGPVVAQNGLIWIDASGSTNEKNGDDPIMILANNQETTINLYAYGVADCIATAALTYSDTAIQLSLLTNHNADWTMVNYDQGENPETGEEYVAFPDAAYLRTTKAIVMDETINYTPQGESDAVFPFDASQAGYALKGWSLTNVADSKIVMYPTLNTSSTSQTDKVTIEDVIFAMADHIAENDSDKKELAAPIKAGKATLFAIWEEVLFNLTVGDYFTTTGKTTEAVNFDFGINDVVLKTAATEPATDPEPKGIASITSKVSKNSFALLRMQQTTAGQYNYGIVALYGTIDSESGVITWTEDTNKEYYTIDMINNGLYKISGVKADLRFVVTMSAVSSGVQTDGYAFQIDQLNNTANGFANLSLDMFDYVALEVEDTTAKTKSYQQIAIEGTYFKTFGTGAAAQRVYGDLKNLTTPATTVTGYIDLDSTGINESAYQYDKTHSIAGRALDLKKDNSVFDLSYQLGDGVSLYAAKGVWNTISLVNVGGATEAVDSVTPLQETPWALYKA